MKSYSFAILQSTRQYSLDEGKNDDSVDITAWFHRTEYTTLFRSNLVIVKGPDDFCCIKDRFQPAKLSQRIPNFLLKPYLKRRLSQYSEDERLDMLIDALTDE